MLMLKTDFWPRNAQISISFSLIMERSNTSTIPEDSQVAGIYRLLDLFDRHAIKINIFLTQKVAEHYPRCLQALAEHNHEITVHQHHTHDHSFSISREVRPIITYSLANIEKMTHKKFMGYQRYWLRDSVNMLELLQKLGFVSQIENLQNDEPFIQYINREPSVAIPQAIQLPKLISEQLDSTHSTDLQTLKKQFNHLYVEGKQHRKMMAIDVNEQIWEHSSYLNALEDFISYVQSHSNVWYATRGEIARWALQTPEITPLVEQAPTTIGIIPISQSF